MRREGVTYVKEDIVLALLLTISQQTMLRS
jgi:hypothetical protein